MALNNNSKKSGDRNQSSSSKSRKDYNNRDMYEEEYEDIEDMDEELYDEEEYEEEYEEDGEPESDVENESTKAVPAIQKSGKVSGKRSGKISGRNERNGNMSHTSSRSRMETKIKNEKKKKRRIIIFALEIIVILVALGVLYMVTRVTENTTRVNITEEAIVINQQVQENVEMKGYRNIALFGVDSTVGALDRNTRSDTIIIASINQDNGEIKLCSVYRDTYLNRGNDTYNKCNSAYANGGPEQAMNMLNMNLDLDIMDFVTVGFEGLKSVIDALGGIQIDVDEAELQHINNYQMTMAEDLKCPYVEVKNTGLQKLDGLQATAYCRIRYTAGSDFKRTERQREVLQAIFNKAKTCDLATLTSAANSLFDKKVVLTSLDIQEILGLLGEINKYSIVADQGFPEESMRGTANLGSSKGDCVLPLDLQSNVIWLHSFLFGDNEYVPSEDVVNYSKKIADDIAPFINK